MGFFSDLFGENKEQNAVKEYVEHIRRILEDEQFQLEMMNPMTKEMVLKGLAYDSDPKGSGPFGFTETNPIPVNGTIGALAYLSKLETVQGERLLFHRIGSIQNIDVFEAVTFSGSAWFIFFLDMYHPRRSRATPDAFRFSKVMTQFAGFNNFCTNFPYDFVEMKQTKHESGLIEAYIPINWVTQQIQNGAYQRPLAHKAKIDIIKCRFTSVRKQQEQPGALSEDKPEFTHETTLQPNPEIMKSTINKLLVQSRESLNQRGIQPNIAKELKRDTLPIDDKTADANIPINEEKEIFQGLTAMDAAVSSTESIHTSKKIEAPAKSTSHKDFYTQVGNKINDRVVIGNLDSYINEINRFALLTPEEEFKLAVRLKKYNDMEAAEKLIVSNLRFVVKIAHEYRNQGFRLADLFQEGNIGLINAVKIFDPYKGYRLISSAELWIRTYIQTHIIKPVKESEGAEMDNNQPPVVRLETEGGSTQIKEQGNETQETCPAQTAADWLNKAKALRDGDRDKYTDPIKAIEYLDNAIKLQPDYAEAYYIRGNVYRNGLNQYQRAVDDYNEAIRLNPDNPYAYAKRGDCYCYDLGDINKAIKDYDKAIGLSPQFEVAYYNRAGAYQRLNKYKEAMSDLKVAARLGSKMAQDFLRGGGVEW